MVGIAEDSLAGDAGVYCDDVILRVNEQSVYGRSIPDILAIVQATSVASRVLFETPSNDSLAAVV